MHILHIYKDYFPVLGGIENHIKALAEGQVNAGHDVTVLVCSRDMTTRFDVLNGVNVIKAGRMATVASMPISCVQPIILYQQSPDVVNIHSPYPLGEIADYFTKRGTVTVVTHHSDVVRQKGWLRIYGPFLKRTLNSSDCIIATSRNYICSSPWLWPLQEKCTVVPLGVDVERFQPVKRTPSSVLRLLFVGCLRYYKGVDVLIRTMSHIDRVKLSIVGTGPMKQGWEQLAYSSGVSEKVDFLNEVADEELPEIYKKADVFILPANLRAEAFGTVLLEAMAAGLPCITTELNTGTSWIVKDGVTGFVVKPGDANALAKAIQALQNNYDLSITMGTAGRHRVVRKFSEQQMVEDVQKLYVKLLAKKNTGGKSTAY